MKRDDFIKKYSKPKYIGDAVYIHFDGYHFILETSNGIEITNSIALEPEVIEQFLKYRDFLYEEAKTIEN